MADVKDDTIEAEVIEEDSSIDDTARTPGALDVRKIVQGLNNGQSDFYSTIVATAFKDKLNLLNALNESKAIDTVLGETFNLANFVVQVVELPDNRTGEMIEATRVTLFDDEGNAYHGTSKGLLTSVRTLVAMAGEPAEWDGPIPAKIVEEGPRGKRYFTIKYV